MVFIKRIAQIVYWYFRIGYRFFFSRTVFLGHTNVSVSIHESVKINNSTIVLLEGASLLIKKGTVIKNLNLFINGNVMIGENNIINNGDLHGNLSININKGLLKIGVNNRIQSTIKIRFGGEFYVGNYNNINTESEVRVDNCVKIGDFNQISYKVNIWDTNTHNIYKADYRRKLTKDKFPVFGYEYERPKTKPIIIANDCWIGRDATLLKGVNLSNKCIVGYKVVLFDCFMDEGNSVVPNISNKTFKNKV